MPAEIDGTKAVYAKTPAWHRIGSVLDDVFTAEQALAVLNPDKQPIRQVRALARVLDDKGVEHLIESDDLEAIVEWDHETGNFRILSYQSKQYGVVQLEDQFRFLDEVVGNVNGAHYEAAVKLRKGRQVCLTVNLGELVLDPGGIADKSYKFLWGFNSYDGSWALRCKFGNFRVECANMAAMALHGSTDKQIIGSDWSTRHTTNVMSRVEEAKSVLGLWNVYEKLYEAQATHMIHTIMDDNAFVRIVSDLFTVENVRTDQMETDREAIASVKTIYELSPSQADLHGTVWGALNAAIEHHDWVKVARGGKVTTVGEKRFLNQIEDPTSFKQRAWDRMWDYAADQKKFTMPDLVDA